MTTRQKTIEFATTVDITQLASNTYRVKTLNIYIPETVVAFRSVALIVVCRERGTATATGTAPTIGISYNGSTWDTLALSNPPANSGESQGQVWTRDVTSYFTANWSGTSATWSVEFKETTLLTADHSFKLVITYDYDDTATTHIKTIRIPIESTRQYVTTSYQTIGGATAIPAIKGSYLPEGSATVRQAFIEFYAAGGLTTGTTDYTLTCRTNGTTERAFWFHAGWASGNAIPVWATVDITADTMTSATSLEVISAGLSNVAAQIGGWITITYEFNPSTTTTVYNSLMLGAMDTVGSIPGTASSDAESWGRDIFIEEPTTITLMESAVVLTMQSAAPAARNVYIAAGAQDYTTYSMVGSSSYEMGIIPLVHRIDAGGQNGTAFATLARGRNAYELRVYSNYAGVYWNMAGCLILNYTSGKATAGVGVHAQTRSMLINQNNSTASIVNRTSGTVAGAVIPEDNYWLVGACLEIRFHIGAGGTTGGQAVDAERQTGEGEAEGWENLYAGTYLGDNESQGPNIMWGAARRAWKRHPLDPDTNRMDIETARQWQMQATTATQATWSMLATWHAHTWAVAGTISGYTSDGSGITVNLHRASDGEYLSTTTTATGGTYTIPWYDNTENVYVEARQDGTHVGRSDNDVAT